MTPIEYDNWRQFSARMAFELTRWRTPARRKRVMDTVDRLITVHVGNYDLAEVISWDDGTYPCDAFDTLMHDWGLSHWDDRRCEERHTDFNTMVMCCVRAGFDIAVCQSAGVAGFTVGNIRRMFPEGLPAYVRAWAGDLREGWGDDARPVEFDRLPAATQVWL